MSEMFGVIAIKEILEADEVETTPEDAERIIQSYRQAISVAQSLFDNYNVSYDEENRTFVYVNEEVKRSLGEYYRGIIELIFYTHCMNSDYYGEVTADIAAGIDWN